eukprot:scaffold36106_cov34-Tisochrysis_lutea.AAC.1
MQEQRSITERGTRWLAQAGTSMEEELKMMSEATMHETQGRIAACGRWHGCYGVAAGNLCNAIFVRWHSSFAIACNPSNSGCDPSRIKMSWMKTVALSIALYLVVQANALDTSASGKYQLDALGSMRVVDRACAAARQRTLR